MIDYKVRKSKCDIKPNWITESILSTNQSIESFDIDSDIFTKLIIIK